MDRHTAEPQVDKIPGERADEFVDYHRKYAATSTYVYDFVWDTTAEAEGPFCHDVDGNLLMDFTSHVAAAPFGYNNPKIMDKLEDFDLVDPLKIAGQDFYVSIGDSADDSMPGPAHLMEKLVELSSHYDMDTVFLSNSGAESIENAIKIAYDNTSSPKYGFTFEGAFHGRTLGALSLNRSKSVYRRKFPEISSIHDVPFCDDRRCTPDSCDCGFFNESSKTGSQISRLRDKIDPDSGHVDPDEVAYIIMEPIQGEGGYRIPSDDFMKEVRDVCDEYDIHLIADEVQAGVGRTGEMWGSDHFAIDPDIISSAKGLRVGATVSNSEIFPDEKSRISSTWGAGDIIASLQGYLTLEAIEEYDILQNVTRRGRQMKEILKDADPKGAVDVRGKGLMLAVEFDTKERRDEVKKAAMKRGLLLLGCGYKTIRLLPPLDVTEREVELGAELFLEAVENVAKEMRVESAD